MSVAGKVAVRKAQHPERFCPVRGCLWRVENARTGERTPCPRHREAHEVQDEVRRAWEFDRDCEWETA